MGDTLKKASDSSGGRLAEIKDFGDTQYEKDLLFSINKFVNSFILVKSYTKMASILESASLFFNFIVSLDFRLGQNAILILIPLFVMGHAIHSML